MTVTATVTLAVATGEPIVTPTARQQPTTTDVGRDHRVLPIKRRKTQCSSKEEEEENNHKNKQQKEPRR